MSIQAMGCLRKARKATSSPGWMRKWAIGSSLPGAERYGECARRAHASFNQRFWFADGGYLFDVVDCNGESGTTDSSCRPNQLFAISLDHPVLERERWSPV